MKKWHYRRIKDENGNILANIITIDGTDIEVSEAVFLAYSQADRRERYIVEEVEPRKAVSLDQLIESYAALEKLGVEPEPSTEEILVQHMDAELAAEQVVRLRKALCSLADDETQLVQALFFDGISVREYARRTGVYHHAIAYQRDKVLEKLRRQIFS